MTIWEGLEIRGEPRLWLGNGNSYAARGEGLGLRYQEGGVGAVEEGHDEAFGAGDGALADEPAEEPEEAAADEEDEEVDGADGAEGQGGDGGGAAEDEEDIEDV